MFIKDSSIIENKRLTKDVYKMIIHDTEITNLAKAGQFLHVQVSKMTDPLLRRPISVFSIDKERGNLELLYKVIGKGTMILSTRKHDDLINIMGPLGRGFPIFQDKKCAIIGGGIGIAPLHELAKQLGDPDVYLGFKDEIYTIDRFKEYAKELFIFTEDGSEGIKGYPTEILTSNIDRYDIVYSCGPKIMMKSVKSLCEEKDIECYISLEENMGCGVGACFVCSCKSNNDEGYKRVCLDGPVFNSKEVSLDD